MKKHNYTLSTKEHVQLLRSHRNMSELDLALAMTLRGIRIKTSKIMKLSVLQSGGYDKTRFTIKDV